MIRKGKSQKIFWNKILKRIICSSFIILGTYWTLDFCLQNDNESTKFDSKSFGTIHGYYVSFYVAFGDSVMRVTDTSCPLTWLIEQRDTTITLETIEAIPYNDTLQVDSLTFSKLTHAKIEPHCYVDSIYTLGGIQKLFSTFFEDNILIHYETQAEKLRVIDLLVRNGYIVWEGGESGDVFIEPCIGKD